MVLRRALAAFSDLVLVHKCRLNATETDNDQKQHFRFTHTFNKSIQVCVGVCGSGVKV